MDFTAKLRPSSELDGALILTRERNGSRIDVKNLSLHLFGQQYLDRQARVLDVVIKEKLFSKTTQYNLSRPDRYRLGLARGKRMRQLMDEHQWDEEDLLMAEYLVDEIQPYHLHMSLFSAAMREQCNEEQRAYWIPKIEKWEIIGAYAQTELGHGSNVRGIECTATWDHAAKEFVLHSPTITASKWWNGTLGLTATHAVVVAQLIIPRKDGSVQHCGPRPFIVQIRNMKTHLPPKSIVVGDIGPKYGYAAMDNAYCLFDQHRIPHSALLSRYAQLDIETGAYSRPKNASSVYGQLTRGRSVIVLNSRLMLARAVTVAVRYLAIRRQFHDQDSKDSASPETQVLDYSTVQIRVLPLLATVFALHYTGKAMWDLYQRTRGAHSLDSDNAQLRELHSTSAGLKSLATELSANGIEICRRAMGGHGFGGATGLISLNNDWLSKPTVEGDNWMITQQVARHLISLVGNISNHNTQSESSWTENCVRAFAAQTQPLSVCDIFGTSKAIVDAFERRMCFLSWQAYDARVVQKRPHNDLLIDFHNLSRAYSQAMLIRNFHLATEAMDLDPETSSVIQDMFLLFAYHTIDSEARTFQSSGSVSSSDIEKLSSKILMLMRKIRPHAVRLVDSFAIPDYLLDSALGRSDGKVYEDLFYRAHHLNPLNKLVVNPNYWDNEIELGSGDSGAVLAKL
ncbi:uncharacterized protein PV09_02918 [Verruconis gallopava]|uniref:Acyl-coenzyme A oxidase n=1 Tax=Verruconis gallopava TaxID=253628 RepID=A0A0D1Z0K0_9PEZI|nr:uncharacterized protein PV09_02918 [Verruconis gallopava]KIW06482.1 hypothetical protein PV09_02918 [Verruconis gallopava]